MQKENVNEQFNQCHPELDSGSHYEIPDQVRNDGIGSESGRSMVEMLGVLAIIGVLTVVGITGFRHAITKHRANELLNEANKRATVVAGQLSLMGLPTGSLNEFTQNEFAGGTFKTGQVSTQNGTFKIGIDHVPDDVCNQMQGMTGGVVIAMTPCTTGDDNSILLTYNNDLSENEVGDEDAGGYARTPVLEDGLLTDDGSTCTGERKGECQVCNQGVYIDSDAVCVDKGGGMCVDGTCKVAGCLSNGDCPRLNPTQCGNGECYCNVFTDVNAYTGPTRTGKCMLKSAHFVGEVTIDGHTYVYGTYTGSGGKTLDWWSSKNFCAAYGKRMITLADVQPLSKLSGYCTWFLDLANDHQAAFVEGGGGFHPGVNRNDGYSCVLCY